MQRLGYTNVVNTDGIGDARKALEKVGSKNVKKAK
jgi:hypothetical protein